MFRESSGSRKQSDAVRLLKIREGDAARGVSIVLNVHRVKFAELIEIVEMDYLRNKRRTWRDVETRLRLHILPIFGHLPASSISEMDIDKFTKKRANEGASGAEVNRELYVINHMFRLGIKRKILTSMPDILQFIAEEDNVRTGFFEEPEFRTLLKFLPEEVKPVVRFAYVTGWRIPSMVLTLKWSNVSFPAQIVRLEPGVAKNKKGINFHFTNELREVLHYQRAITDLLERQEGMVIPWVFHRNGKTIKYFRRSWLSACKKAGLAGRIPHDLRRTAVRNLVRSGVPQSVAMHLTGHKTASVFIRYDITSEGDLKDAAKKLDALGNISGNIEILSNKKENVND